MIDDYLRIDLSRLRARIKRLHTVRLNRLFRKSGKPKTFFPGFPL